MAKSEVFPIIYRTVNHHGHVLFKRRFEGGNKVFSGLDSIANQPHTFSQFYKIAPKSILVAHDELDLAPGTARLKLGGGHGGHNGLRDIIKCLGNNSQFGRLRLGIGHPGNAKLVSGYVLRKAPLAEQQSINACANDAQHIIPLLSQGEWNQAMKTLHTHK